MLSLIPFISFVLVWLLNPGYLMSIFLFYLLPGIFIGIFFSKKIPWAKIFVFSTIISIPFVVIVDYIGTISQIWIVPRDESLFPFRIFHILPIEDYFWLLSAVIFILCYHYVIVPPTNKEKVNDLNSLRLVGGSVLALLIFILLYIFWPQFLVWQGSYSYLLLGLIFFLLPGLLISIKYRLLHTQIKLIPFFLLTTFLFEIIATHYGYWVFTGSYLLHPFSLGGFGFVPLEELFFVGVAGPIACVSLYRLCCRK